jgi:hypothetical protein
MLLTALPDNHVSLQALELLNSQRHLLANDLEIRTRNMMKCFANTPGVLPPPSTAVDSVWNLMPNDKVDTLPMPRQPDVIFFRAPPTTVDAAFTIVKDPSPLSYKTRTPTSYKCGTDNVSSNNITKGYQPKAHEKFSRKTNTLKERALPPSGQHRSFFSDAENSFITQPGQFPIFTGGFETIVDVKMEELRVHGLAFVVKSLLTDGVQSVQSAPLVSMIVHTMSDRLMKETPKKVKRLERALRVSAMEVFRLHWKPVKSFSADRENGSTKRYFQDGEWRNISSTSGRHSALTLTGVNKAGLLGSLFSANIMTADDIALCLTMLSEETHFDRLCAIHALLLYADDRLCRQQNLSALIKLKGELRIVDPLTGLYTWGPVPHSRALIQVSIRTSIGCNHVQVNLFQDILDTIEGWMAVQAHKRKQCRIVAESYSTQKPPLKAVRPRTRAGRMRNKA